MLDQGPRTPTEPNATLLQEQREANERLLLATLRALGDAEDAHLGRIVAEDETDTLRAAAEFRARLLRMVCRDLHGPLNAMLAVVHLLAERNLLHGDTWPTSGILQGVQRVGKMIDQIESFTGTGHGSEVPLELAFCDLALICVNVVGQLGFNSRTRIVLKTTGVLEGRWDAQRISQVLVSLIDNALEHAAPETPVLVSARGDDTQVVVDVRNQGNCISPSQLATIFDPLLRPHSDVRDGNGHLGLGLYISREIALSHGGTIEVDSGCGSTIFSLRLPLGNRARSGPAR